MSYPTDTFLGFIRSSASWVAQEFEHLYAQLEGYLDVEHNANGSHKAIHGESIELTDVETLTAAGTRVITQQMDHYALLTWAPVLTINSTSSGITQANQGMATRVGNLVTAIADIALSNKGASVGSVSITGLPYQPTRNASLCSGLHVNFAAGVTTLQGFAVANTDRIDMYYQGAGGTVQVLNTDLTNTSTFIVSVSYFVRD